jgi:hypothetical protein
VEVDKEAVNGSEGNEDNEDRIWESQTSGFGVSTRRQTDRVMGMERNKDGKGIGCRGESLRFRCRTLGPMLNDVSLRYYLSPS